MSNMRHLRIRVISKFGSCPHNIGDTWETPYAFMKPEGLCNDAHYALIPYLAMAASSALSWEKDGKWRIHCPSKSGVVFEIETTEKDHHWPEEFSHGIEPE